MEFDEYDYLEKEAENPEPQRGADTANGIGEAVKSGENERRSSKHRGDEDDRDLEHRSKRSKLGDDGHDRKERGSREDRYRSGREHKDRDREKDKEERNGRDKGREIERERDPGRRRDRREQDREGEKEREKSRRERDPPQTDRVKDKEREREREGPRRSEGRPERFNGREERGREKDIKEKEPEVMIGRDKGIRRHKEKKEDEPEADPERDQRTVFAYQISLKADERDVYEFFSRAGKVRDVRLIMDRNSRRSKGVGYIEFYDSMSVPMAIALTGQPLLGSPVMVKPSEAEKNLVQSTAATGGLGGPYTGGARRLYVGNLHFNIKEDQLRQVFESFGVVELVQLPLDQETGHCKGFGFVQFARTEDAKAAQSLNGQLDIAGRVIKVSAVTDQAGMQDVGANAADFDDDEGGGLSLNARSRAMLMQKLDRTGVASSLTGSLPSGPILGDAPMVSPLVSLVQASLPGMAGLPGSGLSVPGTTVPTIDMIGTPSECLLLKNMFDPNLETELDFDLDIKTDVEDESTKFGKLKHIHVEKDSAGFVYLRFEDTQSAMNAQRALHGRYFAGKMITATFMPPQNYVAKFPNS